MSRGYFLFIYHGHKENQVLPGIDVFLAEAKIDKWMLQARIAGQQWHCGAKKSEIEPLEVKGNQ